MTPSARLYRRGTEHPQPLHPSRHTVRLRARRPALHAQRPAADRGELLLDGRLLEILTQTRGYRRRRASVRCRRSHRRRRALRTRRRSRAGVEIGGAGVRVSIVTAKNSRKRARRCRRRRRPARPPRPTVRRRRSPRCGVRLAPSPFESPSGSQCKFVRLPTAPFRGTRLPRVREDVGVIKGCRAMIWSRANPSRVST